jgi:hypothetical protein
MVTRMTGAAGNLIAGTTVNIPPPSFPSKRLSLIDLETPQRYTSGFYTNRIVKIKHRGWNLCFTRRAVTVRQISSR